MQQCLVYAITFQPIKQISDNIASFGHKLKHLNLFCIKKSLLHQLGKKSEMLFASNQK